MPEAARRIIYEALSSIKLIDPHTHINPLSAASETLADLLGYHYYTELAHSAGMQRAWIEEPGLSPREQVERLVTGLAPLENTIQYSWLIAICKRFFGFDGERLDQSNWESVYDAAEQQMQFAQWPEMVLEQSNVEAVFLTNDFDDPLEGFDTSTYIPCLRTDDLVFHLAKREVRDRLQGCSGIDVHDLPSLRDALEQRFRHFVGAGARACAISLPPGFSPVPVSDGRAAVALDAVLTEGLAAADPHRDALARRVFWTLAELCEHYGLPFDLMIGVNRGVYPAGVYQGQDLYDSRVSLIQYKELLNAFPKVKFPMSVLASVTNQELVSYAWIFPNVIPNGHWWYSNTPSFIQRDLSARLEAVPHTKQIGYYSDAYKLEFVWPKFDMYRQTLAKVLAESFVMDRGWSEERAIDLGRQILRDNVAAIFPLPELPEAAASGADLEDPTVLPEAPLEFAAEHVPSPALPMAGLASTLGAIGGGAGASAVELQAEDDDGQQPLHVEHVADSDSVAVDPDETPPGDPEEEPLVEELPMDGFVGFADEAEASDSASGLSDVEGLIEGAEETIQQAQDMDLPTDDQGWFQEIDEQVDEMPGLSIEPSEDSDEHKNL